MQKAPELPLRSDMSFCKKTDIKKKNACYKMQKAPELPLKLRSFFMRRALP